MYPADKPQGPTLNIQVFRDDTLLLLTNTSDRSFGPSTLWVNRFYARPIDGLAVGQTMTLELTSFRDEYNDVFRAGGFFATRRPDHVVLIQLETPDELLGLVVVDGEPDS